MGTKVEEVARFLTAQDDAYLIENFSSFSDLLGVSRSVCRPFFVQYTLGICPFYEVIVGILENWVGLVGPDANIPNLSKLLKESQFVNSSDALDSKFYGRPPNLITEIGENTAKSPTFTQIANLSNFPSIKNLHTTISYVFDKTYDHILSLMDSLDFIRRPVVISGMSGIGKSHLMLEIIRRIRQQGTRQQPIITLFSVSTPSQLDTELQTWFRKIGAQWPSKNDDHPISATSKINAVVKAIAEVIQKTQWLVFLDNVDTYTKELGSLIKLLLKNDAFVVMATGNLGISFPFDVAKINIEPLTKEDCRIYLETKIKFKVKPTEIEKLSVALPKIPKVLKPAVAYVLHQHFESTFHGEEESGVLHLAEYLENPNLDFLSVKTFPGMGDPLTIRFYDILLHSIQNEYDEVGTLAVSILEMLSLFNLNKIEVSSIAKFLPSIEISTTWSEIKDSLQLLAKFDFIIVDNHSDHIIELSSFILNLIQLHLTHIKLPIPLEFRPNLICETKFDLLMAQLLSFSNQTKLIGSLDQSLTILESLWENSIENVGILKTFSHIPLQLLKRIPVNYWTFEHQELAYRRIALLRKVLGSSHLEVIKLKGYLGGILSNRESIALNLKGLSLLEECYNFLKTNYGPGYEETLIVGDKLSETLIKLSRPEEGLHLAFQLQKQSNDGSRKYEIASTLLRLEEYFFAIPFLEDYIIWWKSNVESSVDDKFVKESERNIEICKIKIMQQEKQKVALQNLVIFRTTTLGESAPPTLESKKELILLMGKLGEYTQALEVAQNLQRLLTDSVSYDFNVEQETLQILLKEFLGRQSS